MTTTFLVTSLAEEIRAVTAKLRLPVEYFNEAERTSEKTYKPITVYEQMIPKDLYQSETYYPCVIVELVEVTDDLQNKSIATVGISIGVYAKEADGYKDAFHLMETISRRILSVREVAKSFRLTEAVTWRTAQQQPSPFFFVYGEAQYEKYLVQEPFPLERSITPDLVVVDKM